MDIQARNINEAFVIGWHWITHAHAKTITRPSRNGPVIESVDPVVTTYTHPRERVLFSSIRDCNPFFHLFESIWMLAGRNDLAYLVKYLPRMANYSDDGFTINSAYGNRWKELLPPALDNLRKDPNSRRCFIPIFHPNDVAHVGNDMPCNTGISFYIRDYKLDMSVFNRSNDMVWGAYGANVVHFSMLQEYVACLLGVPVGRYSQISSCFHLYTEFDITKRMIGKIDPHPLDPYDRGDVQTDSPMVLSHYKNEGVWQKEAAWFIDEFCNGAKMRWSPEPFFDVVAIPMQRTWVAYKNKEWDDAFMRAAEIQADDWRTNVLQWLRRRLEHSVQRSIDAL